MLARRGIGGPGGIEPLLIIGLVLLAYGFFTGGLVLPVQRAADDPVGFIAFIIAIVLGITVHEFMQLMRPTVWATTRRGSSAA